MYLLPHCRYCGYPDILLHVYLPRVSSADIPCNVTGCQRDTHELPHSRSRGKSEVLLHVYLTRFSDQRRSRGKIQKFRVLVTPNFCNLPRDLHWSEKHVKLKWFPIFPGAPVLIYICLLDKFWSVSACTFDMFQISGDPVAKFMDTLPADSKTTAIEVYIYLHVFSCTYMYICIHVFWMKRSILY